MAKISVVIASYQHAKFVRQSIESVLSQSFDDLEVLVTDDGSIDGTADIVRGMLDPRIKLNVFPENRGACVAMNDAIDRSTGDYVAVLNSDDYMLPGRLEKQIHVLDQRRDLAALFALPEIVDERGARLDDHPLTRIFEAKTQSRQQWLRHFFFHGNALCHPTLMIRRECYAELGGYDPRLAQLPDLDMWIRLARRFEFDLLPAHVSAFRVLDDNANASAPRPEVHARTMWEYGRILQHYRMLDEAEFHAVFTLDLEQHELRELPKEIALGRLALSGPHPCHWDFGLELLYEAVGANLPSITGKELSKLVAAYDVFGVQDRTISADSSKVTLTGSPPVTCGWSLLRTAFLEINRRLGSVDWKRRAR